MTVHGHWLCRLFLLVFDECAAVINHKFFDRSGYDGANKALQCIYVASLSW